MSEIMDWKECEKNFVRNVTIDHERVKSIIEKAKLRLERARGTAITPKTVSFVVEDYYEVIKELLIAYLLKNGLRSKNHQCLISYFLKENPQYEHEAMIIGQMSFLRNRLDYYGEDVPLTFYEKNKLEFGHVIKIILGLLK